MKYPSVVQNRVIKIFATIFTAIIVWGCGIQIYFKSRTEIRHYHLPLQIEYETAHNNVINNDVDTSKISRRQLEDLRQRVSHRAECTNLRHNTSIHHLWRPHRQQLTTTSTAKDDLLRIAGVIAACGVPLDETFLNARPEHGLYDFEKVYLSQASLSDRSMSSSESHSTAFFLHEGRTLHVGDTLSVRVDVNNHRGHPMDQGGDEVRVWVKGHDNRTAFAADVTDLRNGSYLATSRLPVTGKFQVKVGLAHSSHFIRIVTQLHLVLKTLQWYTGLFESSGGEHVSEATPCSTQQHIPFYTSSEMCDLSHLNGSPWFCGKPRHRLLSCQDFIGTQRVRHIHGWRLPVSAAELWELERPSRAPRIRLIAVEGGNTFLVVPGVLPPASPTVPCRHLPARHTWTQRSTGYLSGDSWVHFRCRKSKRDLRSCLKKLDVRIFGDSNSREHLYIFCNSANASFTVDGFRQSPKTCVNAGLNLTVSWWPHAYPFNTPGNQWSILIDEAGQAVTNRTTSFATSSRLAPTCRHIDSIPSSGRVLVVMHHYFHLVMHHVSAYHEMVRSVKEAVVRLVKRNPRAVVVVRGPHSLYKSCWKDHYVAGDGMGRFMEDLLVEEFKDLSDRVIYLRTWDLTVATENKLQHPETVPVIHEQLLDLVCGRIPL